MTHALTRLTDDIRVFAIWQTTLIDERLRRMIGQNVRIISQIVYYKSQRLLVCLQSQRTLTSVGWGNTAKTAADIFDCMSALTTWTEQHLCMPFRRKNEEKGETNHKGIKKEREGRGCRRMQERTQCRYTLCNEQRSTRWTSNGQHSTVFAIRAVCPTVCNISHKEHAYFFCLPTAVPSRPKNHWHHCGSCKAFPVTPKWHESSWLMTASEHCSEITFQSPPPLLTRSIQIT